VVLEKTNHSFKCLKSISGFAPSIIDAMGSLGIHKTSNGGQTAGNIELQDNFKVSVFPNPFSTQTTINTDKTLENATLIVYNSFGQEVRKIDNISGQSILFFRENLPFGLYFLHLKEKKEIISINKLIILNN